MKFLFVYAGLGLVAAVLYFVSKNKRGEFGQLLQNFKIKQEQKSDTQQVIDVLDEMYKDFTTKIKDLETKYQSQLAGLQERVSNLETSESQDTIEVAPGPVPHPQVSQSAYYSLAQISEALETPESTLRWWWKSFRDSIPIHMTRTGVKQYDEDALGTFRSIKDMKAGGMTTRQIQDRLRVATSTPSQAPSSENTYTSIRSLLDDGVPAGEIAKRLSVSLTEIHIVQSTGSVPTYVM